MEERSENTARPRLRSLLFCPGNRPDMIAKLAGSGADSVVVDLEDAVPAAEKEDARGLARDAAASLAASRPTLTILVRVNGTASPWWEDDIRLALGPWAHGVVVPKVESSAQLDEVAEALESVGRGNAWLIAGWESAAGVEEAPRIQHPRLLAAYFGAEDYIADLGGIRTERGAEVAYARARSAMAARIAGVDAIDQAVVDIRDDARFLAEAAEARQLGFRGKVCLHPAQVALAHQVFTPSVEEMDRARRLLYAAAQAAEEGRGVVLFEGQMVDQPLVEQAARLVSQAAVPADLDRRRG